MTTRQQAAAAWEKIKANLEDRSMMHMGMVDEALQAEIDNEAITVISDMLFAAKQR
jgi:hypothetical protein